MADKRISELNSITGANTASGDLFVIVDVDASETKKITRDELTNALELTDFDNIDINGGTIDGTTIGGSTPAAGSFTTITGSGDMNIDSGTLFVDVSEDSVGIGTSSPSSYGGGAQLAVQSGGSLQTWFVGGSDAGGYAFFSNNAQTTITNAFQIGQGWATGSDNISFLNARGANPLLFATNSTERMRIDSSGNLDLTNGGGNVIMASGAGIDFSATANGSGTTSSELLDEYEEGTFTPTFFATGAAVTVTYDTSVGNGGYYVKIGRLVYFNLNIRTDSVSGGSGDARIQGLPFTSVNASDQAGISIGSVRAAAWGGEVPRVAEISEGSTTMALFYRSTVDGDDAATQVSDLGTGTNANLIRIQGCYFAAS